MSCRRNKQGFRARQGCSARGISRATASSNAFHVHSECYNRSMKPIFLVFVAVALTSPLLATAKSHKVHPEPKTSAANTGVTKFSVKGADGSVKNYEIEVPAGVPPGGTGGRISQQEAVLAAVAWAPGFYGSTGTAAISADFKTTPTTYYLVNLTGKIGDSTQPLYAAVLEDGRIVRPSVTTGMPEKPIAKSKRAKTKKSKS